MSQILTSLEKKLATLATEKIKESGGKVTFDEYDKLMFKETYFIPLNWIAGWGLPSPQRKSNTDKMCVFAACQLGLAVQTKTGYEISHAKDN